MGGLFSSKPAAKPEDSKHVVTVRGRILALR
jgi:hypothetical protein